MMKTVAVLAMLVLARPAWGQACGASATGEAFGSYNPFSPAVTTSTATLTVTCQNAASVLVSYTIGLGGGAGGVGSRSMTSGAASLPYQLYRDAAHTQVWGDGTAGSLTTTDGYLLAVLTPTVRTYTAYGVIPAGLLVTPGLYGDTVTVLLTY